MTDTLPAFPLDHLALRGAPDAPALRIKDKVYSYQELNHRIGRLAVILRAQDFTVGDRIATWLPKTELACLMPLAAVRAGLVHVPINPLLKPAQVRHILSDSGARGLLTAKLRAGQLDEGDVPDGQKEYTEIDAQWFKDADGARAKVNELTPA